MGATISNRPTGGDVFLAASQEFTANNIFDLPLELGVNGVDNGTLRFVDGAGSGFKSSIAPPAAGFTANRSIILPDIGGAILMVGTGTSPAGSGLIARVNLTGQTAAITSTILTNGTPAGLYMISTQLACTTVGAGQLQITFSATTDSGTRTISDTVSMTTLGINNLTAPLYLTSGNITWGTAFLSSGSGTYAVRIRASYLG